MTVGVSGEDGIMALSGFRIKRIILVATEITKDYGAVSESMPGLGPRCHS